VARPDNARMHFDLVDLRLFVNIADTSSLTRGAERSHISLPAASVRIKNLEEGLGDKLLYRGSQGVTLAPPGQALAHHAREVLRQLDELRADLHEYALGLKGHLRVYASTTPITEFLPAVLRRYLSSHPDVNIDLRERPSPDVVRAVLDSKVDIGIISGTVRTDGLEVVPYRSDRVVLAVPRGHPLARQVELPFAGTLDYDHVGLSDTSAIHGFLKEKAREVHRSIRLRIQVSNFEACCRMVEAGVGIGLMPDSAAARHSRNMAIEIVQLTDEWALRSMQICVRRIELLPAFARELIALLREDATETMAGESPSAAAERFAEPSLPNGRSQTAGPLNLG
jgi:DNA-binding transcriptional LysR family regulator